MTPLQIVTRWWGQWTTLPWPHSLAMSLQSYLPGPGQPRRLRRLVVRWANLANILALRRLSTECARRFPTFDRLVQAGGALCSVLSTVCAGGFADWAGAAGAGARPPLLRLSLPSLLVSPPSHRPPHSAVVCRLPLQWAQDQVRAARDAGLIRSDLAFTRLQDCLQELEQKNRLAHGTAMVTTVHQGAARVRLDEPAAGLHPGPAAHSSALLILCPSSSLSLSTCISWYRCWAGSTSHPPGPVPCFTVVRH